MVKPRIVQLLELTFFEKPGFWTPGAGRWVVLFCAEVVYATLAIIT
jgi:hypothetical protein